MASPTEDETGPVPESGRNRKRRASQPGQQCPSPPAKTRSVGPSGPIYILQFARSAPSLQKAVVQLPPEHLRLEIAKEKPDQDKPLYAVCGLPSTLLDEMGSCMGIDRSFVNAHAARKCFRPRKIPAQVTWVHWEYPELITDDPEGVTETDRPSQALAAASDLMCEPVVTPLDSGSLSVVFRRVSLWQNERRVVVFLDRAHQGDGQLWKRPKTQISVTKSLPGVAGDQYQWEAQPAQQRALPGIEEDLFASLETTGAVMKDNIESVLFGSVFDHWLEVFDALPEPGSASCSTGIEHLLWQMLQALEQNVQMELSSERKDAKWDCLLKRLERTMKFMAPNLRENQDSLKQDVTPKQDTAAARGKDAQESPTNVPYEDEFLDWEEINRRSLDRITYLGGIMLPLTVVSGILGIEGRYGPEGTQFWVFWVAAFVSSSICILIIYLDQLRSLDIWFEVTANDAVEALFQHYPSALHHQRESGVESVQTAGNLCGPTGNPPRRVYSNRNGDIAIEEGGKLHHLTSSSSSGRGRRTIWFENPKGSGGKTWKKESLGWGGAVKKTVGYYRLNGRNVRFNRPDRGDDE